MGHPRTSTLHSPRIPSAHSPTRTISHKMLRTPATSMLRNSLVRSAPAARRAESTVAASASHAISKPTLANIEKRWEDMPLQEQADLWMALRDRMKGNWKELTVQEQKAAYWIAFVRHLWHDPRLCQPCSSHHEQGVARVCQREAH